MDQVLERFEVAIVLLVFRNHIFRNRLPLSVRKKALENTGGVNATDRIEKLDAIIGARSLQRL